VKTKLKLYPFSLKKGTNIHGIIFGASHPRAVDKFLSIGWKRNGENGDANFDIDEEAKTNQIDIFEGRKLTKLESFKEEVERQLLAKVINNNKGLLEFTYSAGHIPKHAADCVKLLKRNGKLFYDGKSPLVNYENVYKNPRLLEYKIKD
jgi:hypothetical protein